MSRPVRSFRAYGPRLVVPAIGLLLGLYAPRSSAQEVLYGMSDVDQPGGPDEIVQVDRVTGVATLVHVFNSTNFNFLESLAYDARENVFWTTNDGVLIRVQPTTYAAQVIGDTDLDDIDGLAVQPSTGALYGITYGGNDLLHIDKTDAGSVILNGSLEVGSRLEDLAFDSTGRLYVLTSRALVEVNPSTGARISKVLLTGASSLEGLVWDSLRGAFLSAADRGDHKDLVTINRTTGAVAFVSPTQHSGFKDIEALAFAPGTPIVPVAMQALESSRDGNGVRLAWETHQAATGFLVQRSSDAGISWFDLARIAEPVAGHPGAWRYEFVDAEAASGELAASDLGYRVGASDEQGVWSWLQFEVAAVAPRPVVLLPNAPNPFNPTTVFEVRLTSPSRVELALFDISGRAVREIRTDLAAGTHGLVWDGRDASGRTLAAGVYPYVLKAAGKSLHGRAVLVK